MRISVILSTYNSPVWLWKVLCGYDCQSYRDFDLIIADDGSTEDTREIVERFQAESSIPIKHVWHEDNGFRKTEILNKAISASCADYLVISDGDCVPRSDFVDTHRRHARPAHFLCATYYKLTMAVSEAVTEPHIRSGQAFDFKWLHGQGQPKSMKRLRLVAGPMLGSLLNRITPTKANWSGANSSGWRDDILRVNGFDERMKYGGEDKELGDRLKNNGIRPIRLRYSAICLHLEHARGYVDPESYRRNQMIRHETRRGRLVWTPYGIEKANHADNGQHRAA
ncbi:MAG: glycosyltransferase family 2 protein [Planctomycetales bacterium]|nr:glycosyltransferase family 2 protein [Planctomycetales bacterium]